jgi:hypothetical protein
MECSRGQIDRLGLYIILYIILSSTEKEKGRIDTPRVQGLG